ncbi:phage portal protein [Microbacterium oxydans]|nr:phage portal protein [Microbacterium oxydans]
MDEIEFVGYNAGGRTVDLTPLPLAIGTGWDAWSGDGISPLTTLDAILREQTNAVEWRSKLWEERPKFSGIIKRPANAPKWETEARNRWVQAFRDFRDSKAGGAPIFEDGMEWEDWSNKVLPKDAMDIEGRKLTDAEVASAFYIAPNSSAPARAPSPTSAHSGRCCSAPRSAPTSRSSSRHSTPSWSRHCPASSSTPSSTGRPQSTGRCSSRRR